MLGQVIKSTEALATKSLRSSRISISAASQSVSTGVTRGFGTSPVALLPQKDANEVTQSELDANKSKLEKLEHESSKEQSFSGSFKRPTKEELKKKGEDAQVEQHRADDGVY